MKFQFPQKTEELQNNHLKKHVKKKVKSYKISIMGLIALFLAVNIGFISYKNNSNLRENQLVKRIKQLETKSKNKVTKVENDLVLKGVLDSLNETEKTINRIENYLRKKNISYPKSYKNSKKNMGGEFLPAKQFYIEQIKAKQQRISKTISIFQTIPFGMPHVGFITSPYGIRKDPIKKKLVKFPQKRTIQTDSTFATNANNAILSDDFDEEINAFHAGIDIRGMIGDEITTTADGTIVFAGIKGGYGNCIIVQHAHGYKTLYGHLSKINVKIGDKVKYGDVIGLLGNTGRSTGPHVHYEVIQNNTKLDPKNYLSI